MTPPTHAGARDRMAGLDVLRGTAIMLVVIGHYLPGRVVGGAAAELLLPLASGGVVLFFVLSGFLIERNLSRRPEWTDYAVRRVLRIIPAYWVALVVLLGVLAWQGAAGPFASTRVLAANAILLQDFLRAPLVSPVFWTLLVEAKFYAIAPFIVRAGPRAIAAAPLAVLAANAGVAGMRGGEASYLLTFLVFCLVGMTVSLWARRELSTRTLALIVIATAACTGIFTPYYKTGLVLFALASPLALLYAMHRPLRAPVLASVGTVSYSWYLYHAGLGYPVMAAIEGGSPSVPALVTTLIGAAVTLSVACLSYWFVERPAIAAGQERERRRAARR